MVSSGFFGLRMFASHTVEYLAVQGDEDSPSAIAAMGAIRLGFVDEEPKEENKKRSYDNEFDHDEPSFFHHEVLLLVCQTVLPSMIYLSYE